MSMSNAEFPGRDPRGEGHRSDGPLSEAELEAREQERRAQAQQSRPRMNVQQIHSWVDLEIQQALRRGEFENLPGAGKPLKNLDKDDPDWWVKGLIEREKLDMSAALPTVLALRQERRGFPESLAGIADEVAVRERLNDYNARVLEDRRRPVVGPGSPAVAGRVDVDEMVEQWRALRADRERRITEVTEPVEEPVTEPRGARTGRSASTGAFAVLCLMLLVLVVWWAL